MCRRNQVELGSLDAGEPMTRTELQELGYIVPIATVPSILQHGILSHKRADHVPFESIAMQEVQDRRAAVVVPRGQALHEYVNLYINARNPMLYLKRSIYKTICVLRVDAKVVDLPDVVITDSNAGSGYVRFSPAPHGLDIVDKERTFAKYWTHADYRDQLQHKSQMCAEVLVPNVVHPKFITGAYVSCSDSLAQLKNVAPNLSATVNGYLFL